MAGEWTLGIESTAHTFSFGLVDGDGKPNHRLPTPFALAKVAFIQGKPLTIT